MGLVRRCCHSPGGVAGPDRALSRVELARLDQGLRYLAPHYLDLLVCQGLPYELQLKLESCAWAVSTSPAPLSTSPAKLSTSPATLSTSTAPLSTSHDPSHTRSRFHSPQVSRCVAM